VSAEKERRGLEYVPTWVFALSYLAVWTVFGLAAYALYRGISSLHIGYLDWSREGPYVAGGLVVLAGLYELTPLKEICLRHCRSPMHFVVGGWRDGAGGALRMGVEHGAYCLGCCWGLMLVLFAVGVMSILWMAIIAMLIFAQKVLPYGAKLSRVFAVAFVAFGIWIAASPGSVPGLTQPPARTHMNG
jgi:predicted metal-binding membrane protein